MSEYTPDVWVVVKISGNKVGGQHHRVLAGWYGGYAGSDSWKMNSGITKIVHVPATEPNHADCYEVYGESGSVYKCYSHIERFSGYTRQIFESYASKNNDDCKIELVEMKDILPLYTGH